MSIPILEKFNKIVDFSKNEYLKNVFDFSFQLCFSHCVFIYASNCLIKTFVFIRRVIFTNPTQCVL